MKDFMFIFRGGTEAFTWSPEKMQQHMQQWFSWIDQLKAKNIYVSGEPLTPGGKTVKGTKALITDGPFAEGKELVGGYFLIKAESIEQAAEIAKSCPDLPLDGGSVEIREVMKM